MLTWNFLFLKKKTMNNSDIARSVESSDSLHSANQTAKWQTPEVTFVSRENIMAKFATVTEFTVTTGPNS